MEPLFTGMNPCRVLRIFLHHWPFSLSLDRLTQVNASLCYWVCNGEPSTISIGALMKALVDLFSTDYGLFSIAGILFMIGMAIWFYRFFTKKMYESEGNK